MYKLEFTLKQHTPLIHFQHDQEGATLRASEVKPKLDKFLIEKLSLTTTIHENGIDKVIPKKQYENWFNNKEKLSLDYKISFIPNGQNKMILTVNNKQRDGITIYETQKFPLLLANMGGKENVDELKNFTFYKTIKLTIFSYNESLLSEIDNYLDYFFVLNNFGNRQNKGFGSFTILEKKTDKLDILKDKYKNIWYWEYTEENDIELIFNDIANVYSLLKTGINFPDHPLVNINGKRKPDYDIKGEYQFYQKSFLFTYFLEQLKTGNEKRFIKEKFFQPKIRIPNDGIDKKYIRALLGVAAFYEFRDKERRGTINIKSNDIERYKSPINFKVIDNKVCYFIDNSEIESITNKIFQFSDNNGNQNLRTPQNFTEKDMIDLLDAYAVHFNKLINDIDIDLFDRYENNNENFPKPLSTVIATLSCVEINKYM